MEEIQFKVGDKVRCKPGFTISYGDDYGGAGYIPNLEFIIEKINEGIRYSDTAYFGIGTHNQCGVYPKALELATPKEELLTMIL